MSVSDSFQGLRRHELRLDQLEKQFERLGDEGGGRGGNGGGGSMDQIDKRVTRIETNFDSLRAELNVVSINVATLTERVAHLPSKGFIVKALASAVGVLSGIVAIVSGLIRVGWL